MLRGAHFSRRRFDEMPTKTISGPTSPADRILPAQCWMRWHSDICIDGSAIVIWDVWLLYAAATNGTSPRTHRAVRHVNGKNADSVRAIYSLRCIIIIIIMTCVINL